MIGKVGFELTDRMRHGNIKGYLKETFGFSNIATFISWFPVIALYLISNSAFENTGANETGSKWDMLLPRMKIAIILVAIVGVAVVIGWIIMRRKGKLKSPFLLGCAVLLILMSVFLASSTKMALGYFALVALEFGIYWLLLAKDYHREPMFYIIAFLLIIAPCIRVGIGSDFCMRASIPGLTLLNVICSKKLVSVSENKTIKTANRLEKVCSIALIVTLCIGALTPAMEFYRGIHKTVTAGQLVQPADEIETLNKYHSSGGIYGNFVSDSYEDSLFFKYLAQDS